MPRKVERTRNGGTWTEARFFSEIRAALRQKFRYWVPAQTAKIRARRRYTGSGRRKYEYQCASCKQYYPEKEININHIVQIGSLRTLEDLPGFVERLCCESPDDYNILCRDCHRLETNKQREEKKK